MPAVVIAVVKSLSSIVRSRTALQLEVLALRHQLAVYQRAGRRPRLRPADRLLWAWLSRAWAGWQQALLIVQPCTVIAWQRQRFRDHWTRLSRRGTLGRPPVAKEIRDLIRKTSAANPTWGSPRILGELRKLGIEVAKSTVEKYRVSPSRPPSPSWRTFLATHAKDLVSIDFFTVATVRFEILFVLIILAHDRRRVQHFNITAHPTAAWTVQQVVEAFPRYLLRDRDGVYGAAFRTRVAALGVEEVLSAPRSPWQSPYVERVIGSIRRECLDNVVVLHERHLRRILTAYFAHYHCWRCHQALAMDCPEPRPIQPPDQGAVVEVAESGGLYRHYERWSGLSSTTDGSPQLVRVAALGDLRQLTPALELVVAVRPQTAEPGRAPTGLTPRECTRTNFQEGQVRL
ncbi:MAG TPA: integrase core domain-containing protein [Candidatus Acidoferrales bacterium]|nr:integrase core domain-containing protein [Candidatus Acidoferrales bacterium]